MPPRLRSIDNVLLESMERVYMGAAHVKAEKQQPPLANSTTSLLMVPGDTKKVNGVLCEHVVAPPGDMAVQLPPSA